MEIIKIDGVTKCDMPTCRNNATYAIGGEGVMPRRRLNICLACAVELYGLLGAMITPKSPKNHIQAAYQNQVNNKMNLAVARNENTGSGMTLDNRTIAENVEKIIDSQAQCYKGDSVKIEGVKGNRQATPIVENEESGKAQCYRVNSINAESVKGKALSKRDNKKYRRDNSAMPINANERIGRALIGVKC